MKTPIVITDLTRMQEQRVCVAGYAADGRCIRPVLPPPGVQECSLYAGGCPTFPDYLEGRTFADFAPQAEDDDW